jgi:hypothetical protein
MDAYIRYRKANIKHFLAGPFEYLWVLISIILALCAHRLVRHCRVQRTADPTGAGAFDLFAGDIENDAKTRFATHHSLVRLGGFF